MQETIIEKKKQRYYVVYSGLFEEYPEWEKIKLGVIKWHSNFREYYFRTRLDRIYSTQAMLEIGRFMEQLPKYR